MTHWRLTIRPEPSGVDRLGRTPHYRLKVALKRMLRDQGLRCVGVEETNEPDSDGKSEQEPEPTVY